MLACPPGARGGEAGRAGALPSTLRVAGMRHGTRPSARAASSSKRHPVHAPSCSHTPAPDTSASLWRAWRAASRGPCPAHQRRRPACAATRTTRMWVCPGTPARSQCQATACMHAPTQNTLDGGPARCCSPGPAHDCLGARHVRPPPLVLGMQGQAVVPGNHGLREGVGTDAADRRRTALLWWWVQDVLACRRLVDAFAACAQQALHR